MMIMGGTGGTPVGEIFQTPLDGDESWLTGQYYKGTSVKLIQFRKPLTSPEDGSPMDRIQDLEDAQVWVLEKTKEILEYIKNKYGDDLGIAETTSEIADWKAFIASRSSLLSTSSPFMIRNVELLASQRGW